MKLLTLVSSIPLALVLGTAVFPARPNPVLTPGDANPALTRDKVCAKSFRTGPYRHVTAKMKATVTALYGLDYSDVHGDVEIDHLISLELGGANTVKNLWPEEYSNCVGGKELGAHTKDKLENALHRAVCKGKISLGDAQAAISKDWETAYSKWIGPLPACSE